MDKNDELSTEIPFWNKKISRLSIGSSSCDKCLNSLNKINFMKMHSSNYPLTLLDMEAKRTVSKEENTITCEPCQVSDPEGLQSEITVGNVKNATIRGSIDQDLQFQLCLKSTFPESSQKPKVNYSKRIELKSQASEDQSKPKPKKNQPYKKKSRWSILKSLFSCVKKLKSIETSKLRTLNQIETQILKWENHNCREQNSKRQIKQDATIHEVNSPTQIKYNETKIVNRAIEIIIK